MFQADRYGLRGGDKSPTIHCTRVYSRKGCLSDLILVRKQRLHTECWKATFNVPSVKQALNVESIQSGRGVNISLQNDVLGLEVM